ncbi:MAG: gliding motility lipoprotein GldH [Chlorobi bacterium]|nr:gliding motility lipoprotein GldH [Chlorobiota bacterium]
MGKTGRVLVSVILLVAACRPEQRFEYRAFKTFDNERWERTDTVRFRYEARSEGLKNFYFYLENTNAYPYANLFVIARMQKNDTLTVDTLEYRMADGRGRWLGRKVRHAVENLLVYRTGVHARPGDVFEISVEPATRRIDKIEGDEYLPGIRRFGFIVENMSVKQ